jgi:hypothetical protein
MNFDPADGSVRFAGWTGGGNASVIFRGMRYYLEDKPQYLDDPNGEFWFDKRGKGGTCTCVCPAASIPHGAHRGRPAFRPDRRHGRQALGDQRPGFPLDHAALGIWTWRLGLPHQAVRVRPDANRRASASGAAAKGSGSPTAAFEDVVMGIRMRAIGEGSPIRDITVEDNVFRNTDVGAAI